MKARLTWPRALGIAAALCVPAVAIAQFNGFSNGQTLTAASLNNAISRVHPAACVVRYTSPCNALQCNAICATSEVLSGGGCDVGAVGNLYESYPIPRPGAAFPSSGSSVTQWGGWNCRSDGVNVQTAFAICCPN